MKKALLALSALLILLLAIAAGTLWYIRPTEQLDLSYTKISVFDKVADMVLSGQLKLELSDADLTNLVRLAFRTKPQLTDQIRVEGARITVLDDKIALDVNLRIWDKIKAGGTLYGTLRWSAPNLIVELESGYVKGVKIPASLLPEQTSFSINLYEYMPALIGIKSIETTPGKLAIGLKIPR
jgi:hypothetical protein